MPVVTQRTEGREKKLIKTADERHRGEIWERDMGRTGAL